MFRVRLPGSVASICLCHTSNTKSSTGTSLSQEAIFENVYYLGDNRVAISSSGEYDAFSRRTTRGLPSGFGGGGVGGGGAKRAGCASRAGGGGAGLR
ncbi:MAG: hypothetical protein QGH66_01050, partial [Dehalococcoidia bacterium]|nr:hypothetical protein [Dehalococcoidia bacterium]